MNDTEPDKVYECIFGETTHALDFYWRDNRDSELQYWTEDKLPKDRCNRIAYPNIGAELSR